MGSTAARLVLRARPTGIHSWRVQSPNRRWLTIGRTDEVALSDARETAQTRRAQGELEGRKLIGFSISERREGGGRNVTFPARQYTVNGERRSFALLRPVADTTAQERLWRSECCC